MELQRSTGQRGLLVTSYKGLEKDSDRAITPVMDAICVPEHLSPPGSLQAKQLHYLQLQLSLGRAATGQKKKKVLCLCAQGHFGPVQLIATLCRLWPARLLCQRGVLQARILESIGQYRLPYPSPGDLPNPGMEPRSLALQADALTSEPPGKPRNDFGAQKYNVSHCFHCSPIYLS